MKIKSFRIWYISGIVLNWFMVSCSTSGVYKTPLQSSCGVIDNQALDNSFANQKQALVILSCKSKREIQPQTALVTELFKTDFCTFLKDFEPIKPQIIPWATDETDPYSESFILPNNSRITFKQDGKDPETQTQGFRHCFVNNEEFMVKQIVIDSLSVFKFEDISIDYGQEAENIYAKNEFIMFLNQPMGWSGKSNQYKFVQVINLKEKIYYEFFVNYYSCKEKQEKQKQ